MYAEVKNFKSEIGCVIVFKMLIYRKIRGYLEMTNENVRFFFVIFQLQKYIYFLNLQFFLQSFFLFYILSYQSDSLICTKNLLLLTNLLNAPKK